MREAKGRADGIQIFIDDKIEDSIPNDKILEKLQKK